MTLVSVVIPAYNAERYVGAAIESVLAQTARHIEIVVVDDGSTDGTLGVLQRYGAPVRWHRQENSGVAVARNRGISESRGDYVAFLDADDTWMPEKIDRQLGALRKEPQKRLSHSAFVVCDGELRPLRVTRLPPKRSAFEDLLFEGNVVGCPTVLCERRLFDLAGAFDPDLSQCADWDMWIRLARLTEFVYVDEPLAMSRRHEANMSRNISLYERDALRVLDKVFRSHKLPASVRDRRRRVHGRMYMVLAGSYFEASRYGDSVRCALRAIAHDPRQAAHVFGFPVRRLLNRRSPT